MPSSLKSKLLSAWVWAAPALTAALPLEHYEAQPQSLSSLLDLDVQAEYAQATFSLDCPGCHLSQDNDDADSRDALVLTIQAHATEKPCASSNLRLNGDYLSQDWTEGRSSGSANVSSSTRLRRDAQHTLDLEWEVACINGKFVKDARTKELVNDPAQILALTIKGIDGRQLDHPAGFTLSYKQSTSPPQLVRFEGKVDRLAWRHPQDWAQPPAGLRLSVGSIGGQVGTVGLSSHSSLEDEIRELRRLQAQVYELQKKIKKKKKHIHDELKHEANSLGKDLKQCKNLTCIVKIVADKAHGAFRLLYVRLRPESPLNMGKAKDDYVEIWRPKHNAQPDVIIDDSTPLLRPNPFNGYETSGVGNDAKREQKGAHVIVLEIFLGALCCGSLLVIIRQKCASQRTKTERAAREEERRNIRAYRRAARNLAWRKWWNRGWSRDQERIEDYEEKRALIVDQEFILEEAMQEEIRQLRSAHGLVNSLVQAEEGRIETSCNGYNCHCRQPHQPTDQAPPSPASSVFSRDSMASVPSRPLSRTSSLPSYRSRRSSAPPAYEDEDEDEDDEDDDSDHVANGFRPDTPTPSTSSQDTRWTPDSSVVDVSPRPSADTLRYPLSVDTVREEDV